MQTDNMKSAQGRNFSWKGKGKSRKYYAIIKTKMQNTTGNSKIQKFIKIDAGLADRQRTCTIAHNLKAQTSDQSIKQ